jgi:CubicO group peptidase (beta-lactamase class C family)
MQRRNFLQCGIAAAFSQPLLAALRQDRLDDAAEVLSKAVAERKIASAVLHVTHRETVFNRSFGTASSEQAMFLLGSITKPVCVTALMALFDRGEFKLDDRLNKYIPGFKGDMRDDVTIRHLLTHVSGLPDQLADNNELRRAHSPLPVFVEHAIRTPLGFAPGTKYQYSSMAILLACHVAEIISGSNILELVERTVLRPLEMKRSALGLGQFKLSDMVPCQIEHAAPEAGAGDPTARDWDWNSPYWRKLGAPWGGLHASAQDVGRFLAEFLGRKGAAVKPDTAALMVTNHNPAGLTSRGLGFNVGPAAGSRGCSDKTFGHTGSTGTLAWADPATDTICVVLTSLPGAAVKPHPRELTANHVAAATQ